MPPRASPSTTIPSTSAGRPSSAAAAVDLALVEQLADRPTTRRPRAAAPAARRSRAARSSVEVAAPPVPEAEVLAGDDHPRADRLEVLARELLGLDAAANSSVNSTTSVVLDAELGEQLEPPLERRQSSSTP